MNKEQYEQDLKRRQEEHLKKVNNRFNINWKPCAHDQCQSCHGTGIKVDGSSCIHYISCDCPKCSPQMISTVTSTW